MFCFSGQRVFELKCVLKCCSSLQSNMDVNDFDMGPPIGMPVFCLMIELPNLAYLKLSVMCMIAVMSVMLMRLYPLG